MRPLSRSVTVRKKRAIHERMIHGKEKGQATGNSVAREWPKKRAVDGIRCKALLDFDSILHRRK